MPRCSATAATAATWRVHGTSASSPTAAPAPTASSWQQPAFEVICLACELSAYAPDDGGPLF